MTSCLALPTLVALCSITLTLGKLTVNSLAVLTGGDQRQRWTAA